MVPTELLGVYLNPDEIQKEIEERNFLDLRSYAVQTTKEEILPFFIESTLLRKADLLDEADQLRFADGKLSFFDVIVNAYFASVAADFIRKKLLEKRVSFSFETVMSSPDKIELLERARLLGYRTYLYYIATEDPEINIARVKSRVHLGGHDVPKDKIVSRYARSLDLLLPAIRQSNRAYLFDNSRHGGDHLWVAEITDGRDLETKCSPLPRWFQRAVWEKITQRS